MDKWCQDWGIVEVGYPGRGKEQENIADDADGSAIIERSGEVGLCQLRLPDHSRAKTSTSKDTRHSHEDAWQGGDAIVLGRQQTGHEDANNELNAVIGELVQELPV